jgi:hypothetical protein
MTPSLACRALQEGRVIDLSYRGFLCSVEVHLVGHTRDGRALMRVWQVRGCSVSGEPKGWKTMMLDDIAYARLTPEPSRAPRPDFNPGDATIVQVICQV